MRTFAIANRSGNRELAKSGGNSSGTGLRTETYTPTLLNHYSQRTEANTFDVMGLANASATVTVNALSTYRKNEYFQKALTVSNGSNPVWQQVDIVATLGGSSTSSTGFVYTAKTPVVYSHDDDGNKLTDGQWNNTWDGENRLIKQESISAVPTAAKKKLEYEYDYRGRRIRKKSYDWVGSAWVLGEDVRFIYDGWNLIAEINTANTVLTSFMWGLDLSGSLQGAGGVGGLVKMMDHGTGKHYFYGYDGNGNVMSLVDGTAGTYAANYEYGPFGEMVRASGAMAALNPFRFSTKYQDDETGLLYYGYRYYNPDTGRWLNRDPIGERGGKNVYGFGPNRPVMGYDLLGGDWTEEDEKRLHPQEPPSDDLVVPPGIPGERIVAVPIPDPDNPDNGFIPANYDEIVNNANEHGFQFVPFKNKNSLKKKLNCVSGCIGTLYLTGHGSGASQTIGPRQWADAENDLGVGREGTPSKVVARNLDVFEADFCKPCVIVLSGCSVCTGPSWKDMFKAIHAKTGCQVWGHDESTYPGRNKFLPGGRKSPEPRLRYPEYLPHRSQLSQN